jgi:hypothetical protein
MAPRIKYDDTQLEKTTFNGKVLMYCTPGWETLYPIVDIIRLLKSNTIISFKFGKGQGIIKTYGMQYGHRVTGYQIGNKQEYIDALRMVKCVFVFTDSADSYAETFINMAKTLKILLVCYSNLDKVYHFYNNDSKINIKTAQETIDHIYTYFDLVEATKMAELFPDFEIIEAPVEEPKESVLDECLKKLKKVNLNEKIKKDSITTKVYDPNLVKIRAMEESRKKVSYDESYSKANIFSKFK